MADVHSKEVRGFNMSRIKGKDTLPGFTKRIRYSISRIPNSI